MTFVPFDLERWQSVHEHRVWVNLSESGVHPLTVAQLLELAGGTLDELTAISLGYAQGDGSDELRAAIAELYPGASEAHVTVTTGSAEANFITCWTLIEPGSHVAIVTPTYMQTPGLARNFGATVSELPLRPDHAWKPDLAQLKEAIPANTRLVIVTNPNNPTGHILSDAARRAILGRAAEVGAWVLADEVYQGAELAGDTTPSLWGSYERLIVVNGFSKAYGLPGLRIGWIVGPEAFKEVVVQRHDYTVICPAPVSDYLARQALRARSAILARTRGILTANYPIIEEWLQSFGGLFQWQRPESGAICFARYHHPIGALELVERVRRERNILLVPGDHFARPQHIRFGFGNDQPELRDALEALRPAFSQLMD